MYSNFYDENHTYHLAHYGRADMKWGKHIFGGRDRAFSKSGVRRVRKNYEWGGFNNTSFYEKSPNYDAAATKLMDRVNVINGQPGKPGKSRRSSNSKWYEQATTAQRKRGVTSMAGRNVRGAVDDVKSKIRAGRNHGLVSTNKPTDGYREYLSASSATVRKTPSKGFPSPVQPGETFKRRKDSDPKIGHYTKHPEQKKSVAPSKSSNARGGNENWKGDYSRESLDKVKSTAVRRGLKDNLVVTDKDKHRAMLEAQSQPRKRKRGARR